MKSVQTIKSQFECTGKEDNKIMMKYVRFLNTLEERYTMLEFVEWSSLAAGSPTMYEVLHSPKDSTPDRRFVCILRNPLACTLPAKEWK